MKIIETGQIELAQTKYLWTIPNFANLYRSRQFNYIFSPQFTVNVGGVRSKFILIVRRHVRFANGTREKYVNICLTRVGCGKSKSENRRMNASIRFELLDSQNEVICEFGVTKNHCHSEDLVDLAIPEAMLLANEKRWSRRGPTFVWNFVGGAARVDGGARERRASIRLREFDDLDRLVDSEKFSDVALCVGGRTIHAHRSLLANKSPVFDAMFTHDMRETRSGRVVIEDIGYDAVRELLRYVYAGKVSDDDGSDSLAKYSSVMMAADKYLVDGLKRICEMELSVMLTVDNVFDCYAVAEACNAARLKRKVIGFMRGNAGEIVNSASYESFVEALDDVPADVARALAVKRRKIDYGF